MPEKKFIKADLTDPIHCEQILILLNEYMEDEMGVSKSMPHGLGVKIIEGLKKHSSYLGFFICIENKFVALANCNLNYSTWQASFLINIHDFIVSPTFRKQGVGEFLLVEIEKYAQENGYCKLNLEVRNDNLKAQNVYNKMGYTEYEPPMLFWQKLL